MGVKFDIAIEANNIGVASSTAELNDFAAKIVRADTVATSFDAAVAATTSRLAEAASASKLAAAAVSTAEKRYSELESSANRASKALEKASAAGQDTTELAAAAQSAKAAMAAQATVVDELRAKSDEAADAQKRLADTLSTMKGAQASESAAIKKRTDVQTESTGATELSIAAYITIAKQIYRVARAVYDAAKAFAEFVVSQDPATVQRLTKAYAKLQLGVKALFSGLKFDKFAGGLEKVMSLFDEGTASARGMKALVETILQPLLDGVGKIAPYVKAFFEGMIHGALLAVIAVLKIRNAIFDAMSPDTRATVKKFIDQVFTLQNAFEAGKWVAIALAVALGGIVIAMAAMLAVELLLLAPIIAIIEAFKNWGAISAWLKEKWSGFVDWLSGLWDKTIGKALNFGKNLAANIIAGLTGGLAEGSPQVKKSIDGVLDAAEKGAQTKLDSHSPSRVYHKYGLSMPQGLEGGVDEGAPLVTDAVDAMLPVPDGAASGGGSTSPKGKGTVNFYGPVTIGDSPVAQENFAKLKAAMLEVLEGGSLTIGGGEVPA